MSNLALFYRQRDRFGEAEPLYRKALEALSRTAGPNDFRTLTVKHNLGSLYGEQGKLPAAETLYKEVLKGLDEPGTHRDLRLICTKNLGLLYAQWNRPDDARPLIEEAVEGMSTLFGTDQPDTLQAMRELAIMYRKWNKLDKAIPLFEKTVRLATDNKNLGPDHPTTLVTRAFLGASYCDAGRPDDGIRCLEDVLARARKGPVPLPPDVSAGVPHTLAEAYDRTGQFARSEPLYREFLEQAAKQFGADDPRTAGMMTQLGMNLLRQKKYADAERTLRDCLAVREDKQSEEWTTFNTKSQLGGALLGQKKYADAEPLLVQGYEGMKQREAKIPPPGKARLTEALERLVRLYEATDQKDKADEWRRKLDAAKAPPPAATKP
jgi:tetratricopeptide (TPR) repeat protein